MQQALIKCLHIVFSPTVGFKPPWELLYAWNAQSCASHTGFTSGLPQRFSYRSLEYFLMTAFKAFFKLNNFLLTLI
jgi:hypothetical protein